MISYRYISFSYFIRPCVDCITTLDQVSERFYPDIKGTMSVEAKVCILQTTYYRTHNWLKIPATNSGSILCSSTPANDCTAEMLDKTRGTRASSNGQELEGFLDVDGSFSELNHSPESS